MDDIMTLSQAAQFLKIGKQTMGRLAMAKKVPGKKVGHQWRFHRSALEKFLGVPSDKKPAEAEA